MTVFFVKLKSNVVLQRIRTGIPITRRTRMGHTTGHSAPWAAVDFGHPGEPRAHGHYSHGQFRVLPAQSQPRRVDIEAETGPLRRNL